MSVITAVIIFNPFNLYFLNDDFIYVPQSKSGNYLYGTAFRPVSNITLLFDFLLYHKQAWGYHITNLFIHLIATFSVFQLAKQSFSFFKINVPKWAAHAAAIFFLFYAFHSESVYWIIGRGGSLVTIFFALALNLVLRPTIKTWQLVLSLFWFIIGMLTYESIWVLPFIIAVVAFYKSKIYHIKLNKLILEPLLFWIIFISSFIIKKILIDDFVGSPYHYSVSTLMAVKTLIYEYLTGFFRSFLFPASAIYFTIGCVVVTLFFIWFLISGVKKRWFTNIDVFLAICFLTSLSPIALLGVNTHNTESERFLYLPSVFVCIFFAIIIARINENKLKVALIALFLGYNIFFLRQSSVAYKVAGEANKTIMQEIGKVNGDYNVVHVINLPTQYKGGFMFRIAFANALKWMCPNLKYNQQVVYSKMEYLKPIKISVADSMPNTTATFIKSKKIIIQPNDLLIAWDGEKLFIKSGR